LYKIIQKVSPQVIFLEAVDETYSKYEKYLLSTYGVYHQKLEISAIQKYSTNASFKYVPVCENTLPDAFHTKNRIVCQYKEIQNLIDNFNSLAAKHGFKFLNSSKCMDLQNELRLMESQVLNDSNLDKSVREGIDSYENPMIRNIYSYCNHNHFSSAIFMCGAAHRKSIIEKIEKSKTEEKMNLTWTIFEN
jgi:hypothetical protein